jgi:predicted  nucleic acid-binding Zn-ribbon protein
MRDLDELIELQVCDGEIARMMAELAVLPKRAAELQAALSAVQAALAAAESGLKAEEVARRRAESDVRDQQQRIKKYRAQVDVVQNDEQYKALLKEISFAEETISRLEDAELESMERTDGFETAKKKAEEEIGYQTKLVEQERERATGIKAAHDKRLVLLKNERERLRALVTEPALAAYDRVAGARKTGLAAAWDQKCSACQMMVRPQRWNELRSSDQETPMTCETCGRRLYYDVGHGTDASRERAALRRLEEMG